MTPSFADAAGDVSAEEPFVFMPGERWTLSGPLTVDTAARVLAASQEAALPDTGVVALGAVDGVDSAGVAVLLSWQRRAGAEGRKLVFADVPASLVALAELYGVEELLQAGQ